MPIKHTKQIIRKFFGTKSKDECTDGSGQVPVCLSEGPDESYLQHQDGQGADESQLAAAAAASSSVQALPPSPQALTAATSSLTKRAPSGKTAVFFARVPPTATQDELLELFSRFGVVDDVNLFRPFAEAKTSKGCGIVRYTTSAAAAAAKAALHNKHKWTAESSAMVVEWVNEEKMRSASVKAGSSEVVFEPKSRTGKHKHAHLAAAGSSSSAGVSASDLAAAAAAAVAAGNRISGSGDLSQFWGVPNNMLHSLGPHSGSGFNPSLCGGFAAPIQPPMPMQPPPPPLPRGNSLTWQQQQQQPVSWSAHSAGAALGHVSADVNVLYSPHAVLAQQQQHHHQQQQQRLLRSSYPGSSSGAAAAAAAAGDQSDIVQAVLAASTRPVGSVYSARDAFIPTYGSFSNDSSAANELLQQWLLPQQQQQQLAIVTSAQLAMHDNVGTLSAGALAAAAAAATAGMSGETLGMQSQPFLQQRQQQRQQQERELYSLLEGSSSADAQAISRQHSSAAAAAAGGAWARIQSPDLATTVGLDLGMSGDLLPRQIASAGGYVQDPMFCGSNAAAVLQQQLSGTLSGPMLQGRSEVWGAHEEQWAAGDGAGYFDMPAGGTSSSFPGNPPTAAGLFTSNPSGSSSSGLVPTISGGSGAILSAAAAAQQAVASGQSDLHSQQLSNRSDAMRALTDPSLIGIGDPGLRGLPAHSFPLGQQQQVLLQQQILRQQQQLGGMSMGLSLPTTMGAAVPPNPAAAAAAALMTAPFIPPPPAAAASTSSSALPFDLQQKLSLLDLSKSNYAPDRDPNLCGSSSSSMKLSAVIATGAVVIPALAPHIQLITNMTGAAVQIVPIESGEITVYVTGTAAQINAAKGIADMLLQQHL